MKKFILTAMYVALGICFLCSGGCISLQQKHVEQNQYELKLALPGKVAKHISGKLDVYYPQIDYQFASSSFVYRVSDLKYITDYYNVFFGSPIDQIQEGLIKYLHSARVFNYVAEDVYPLKADYALKTTVFALYGDYRNPNLPKAVIGIRFVLLDLRDTQKVVLDKNFKEEIPLQAKSSEALVAAWNTGLNRILRDFVGSL
jgi:ABC-type uncharacterized transport system auxiliary subunit